MEAADCGANACAGAVLSRPRERSPATFCPAMSSGTIGVAGRRCRPMCRCGAPTQKSARASCAHSRAPARRLRHSTAIRYSCAGNRTQLRKDNEDEQSFAGWIEVPLFNDGKLAIAVKVTEQNARFEEQTLFVFDDLNYFEARTRVDFMGLWNDPRLLQPLKQFMENNLGSFAAIPKTMRMRTIGATSGLRTMSRSTSPRSSARFTSWSASRR